MRAPVTTRRNTSHLGPAAPFSSSHTGTPLPWPRLRHPLRGTLGRESVAFRLPMFTLRIPTRSAPVLSSGVRSRRDTRNRALRPHRAVRLTMSTVDATVQASWPSACRLRFLNRPKSLRVRPDTEATGPGAPAHAQATATSDPVRGDQVKHADRTCPTRLCPTLPCFSIKTCLLSRVRVPRHRIVPSSAPFAAGTVARCRGSSRTYTSRTSGGP